MAESIKGLKGQRLDGTGLNIAIVRTRWNAKIIDSLVEGCRKELALCGVAEDCITEQYVPGAYELPYAASRMILSMQPKIDAVICIGCLIKGSTMHFEYICEAVTQGIMRLNLETGIPVIFGVLACLTELQAEERAGLVEGGHNHGIDWAQGAVEMGLLKRNTSPK